MIKNTCARHLDCCSACGGGFSSNSLKHKHCVYACFELFVLLWPQPGAALTSSLLAVATKMTACQPEKKVIWWCSTCQSRCVGGGYIWLPFLRFTKELVVFQQHWRLPFSIVMYEEDTLVKGKCTKWFKKERKTLNTWHCSNNFELCHTAGFLVRNSSQEKV